jgi:hypothetical protein
MSRLWGNVSPLVKEHNNSIGENFPCTAARYGEYFPHATTAREREMVRVTHRRGRYYFYSVTPSGEPIAIEIHARAWRQNRFPRLWKVVA